MYTDTQTHTDTHTPTDTPTDAQRTNWRNTLHRLGSLSRLAYINKQMEQEQNSANEIVLQALLNIVSRKKETGEKSDTNIAQNYALAWDNLNTYARTQEARKIADSILEIATIIYFAYDIHGAIKRMEFRGTEFPWDLD